ncbi:oligosaccharide flippase family protein [Priestia megaterium]
MKNKSLIKTFFSFSIGPLGAAIINFLTVPITTWLISPEEFGKTSLFLLMQALATAVMFLGLDQAYVREYNEKTNKKELLFNCMFFPFFLSLLISFLLIFFSENITNSFLQNQSQLVIIMFAVWLPFITLERFLLLSIRMEERGLVYSVFNILVKFLIMIFTIVLLICWSKSYLMVIAANVIGQIITDFLLILYCRSKIILNLKYLNLKLLKKMIKFGSPFVPTAIIMWFLNSTDRLALEKFSSYDELGIYFAALKIVGVLTIFQSIFATVWLPIAYKWQKENVSTQKFTQASRYIAFSMSFVFIFILLIKDIFVYVLSVEYKDVTFIIPFLLFYPIMYTLGETTGLGISFSRKTHYNIWISIILSIVNVALNFLLVPYKGAIGASIALGCTYIAYFWIRTLVSRKFWYEFNLTYYFILNVVLVIVAVGNLFIHNYVIYLFNGFFLILISIYNRNILNEIYMKLKERLKWKKLKLSD